MGSLRVKFRNFKRNVVELSNSNRVGFDVTHICVFKLQLCNY